MSSIAVKGADTGTGVFTIESPATNTDRTITLPDEAGALATQAYVGTQALGVGQTWQDVTGSRGSGVTYTNNTGKPIFIIVSITGDATYNANIAVDGVVACGIALNVASTGDITNLFAIVPNGSTYLATLNSSPTINDWKELR